MAIPELINSPHADSYDVDLAAIQRAAGDLRRQGGAIRDTGVQVDTQWQGLRPHYRAPESELLLRGPERPRAEADVIAKDLERVAAILDDFVREAGPLVARLKGLREQPRIGGSEILDWDLNDSPYAGRTSRKGGYGDEVSNTLVALEGAERLAADKIAHVYGGQRQGPAGDAPRCRSRAASTHRASSCRSRAGRSARPARPSRRRPPSSRAAAR